MPRNKRTQAKDLPNAQSLPELTAQQMAFVRGILEGKTNSDAYRAAYSTENMLPETIWAEASRVRSHHKVSAWLSAARQANEERATLTLEGHMSELARLREIALSSGNIGAAVLAETNRGKAQGLYTERYEDVSREKMGSGELVSRIAQISPEAARALARDLGIDPETVGKTH